jgi:hypothetical protein
VGDRVKFFVHPDGSVVLLPKRPVTDLRALVKTKRSATLTEMDDAVARGAAARVGGRNRR